MKVWDRQCPSIYQYYEFYTFESICVYVCACVCVCMYSHVCVNFKSIILLREDVPHCLQSPIVVKGSLNLGIHIFHRVQVDTTLSLY